MYVLHAKKKTSDCKFKVTVLWQDMIMKVRDEDNKKKTYGMSGGCKKGGNYKVESFRRIENIGVEFAIKNLNAMATNQENINMQKD